MSQQNIDFGTFPDDPSADAIRTAFQKVQNNFSQLFSTYNTGAVTSVNQTPGAGISVNFPTGNVVISANIACLQISTTSLRVGRGSDNTQTSTTITNSGQVLNIDVDPARVYSNYFADVGNGSALFYGQLIAAASNQPNISNIGTLSNLISTGIVNFTGASNISLGAIGNVKIAGGGVGQYLTTDGAGNLSFSGVTVSTISNGTSNLSIPSAAGNVNISVGGGANIFVVTSAGAKITGTISASGNANVGNIGTTGVFATTLSATGNSTAGILVSTIATGTAPLVVTSTTQVANLSVATAGSATTAGTVTTNAQPNITSTGTLTTLSVSGNANVGNIGTAGIFATTLSTTGNANVGNIGAINGVFTNVSGNGSSLSSIAGGNVTGTVANATYATSAGSATTASTITTNAQPNITSTGTLTTLSVSGNANIGNIGTAGVFATTLSSTGNANVGNIGTAGVLVSTIATGTAPFTVTSTTQVANLSVATAGSATTAGTVTTNAQPNITSTGTLTTLSVSGNANVGNLGVTGVFATTLSSTGNANIGNIGTAGVLISTIATGTAPFTVTSTTRVANLNVATSGVANTVNDAAQANITSVGTLTTVSVSGNANIGNIGTGIITASGNITGANIIVTTNYIHSVATAISAAGTVQANATAITKDYNVVSTVSSGQGVVLPTAVAGMRFTVLNTSANALLVYPAVNGIINSLAANAAFSMAASGRLDFLATTTTQWYTLNATYN